MQELRHLGKVLITNHIPKCGVDILRNAKVDVDYRDETTPMGKEELITRVKGCDGLLCTLIDKIDRSVLSAGRLQAVSTMTVGYDHIDIESCKELNIAVCNTPGVLTETTAELALSLMLATNRRLFEASNAVKNGEWGSWKTEWMLGKDIFESTIGIVGFGDIGKAVAKRLVPFQCKSILVTQPRKPSQEELDLGFGFNATYVPFEELLKSSDIISLHCPLNSQTEKMFGKEAFSMMKPTAILINTSRGSVIDQDALYDALTNQEILAAGLDVTVPEPIPTYHSLLSLPNCVILPHIGSASENTRQKMAKLAAENLVAALSGNKIPHPVTK